MTGPRPPVLLRDVAKRANVSDSTASRALADDPRIGVATRTRVKAAAADLRYLPNAAARSLRVHRTRTLGILLPDVRYPVHGEIASAFEQEASQAGYGVMVVSGERDAGRERLGLRTFAEHGTDGVAVVSSLLTPGELGEQVDAQRLVHAWPDLRSMTPTEGPAQPGVIRIDEAGGVRATVNHLVDGGSRRIAYAGDELRASNAVRVKAMAATLRERGIRSAPQTLIAPNGFRRAEELAAAVAVARPDAIVCRDDELALELMDALRRLRIAVPEDIAIVGFDGIPFGAIANPRLTTVAVPTAEIGRRAAAFLIHGLKEGGLPDGIVLPVELIVRESSRLPAAGTVRSDG